MAMEIAQETGEEVAKLCQDFTTYYIGALVNAKLEDLMDTAVSSVMPDGLDAIMSGDDAGDEQGDDVVEEKGDDEEADDEEEKGDGVPFASGVCVIAYKTGRGPDNVDHRYYDIAGWSLKPKGSVIQKAVARHTQLLRFTKELKKAVKATPAASFPAKKLATKRTAEFYKERMKQIHTYFETITVSREVTESEVFLQQFELQTDEEAEFLNGIFFEALQSMCEDMNINWNSAKSRAERVGIDLDAVEMLKVVAIEKLGKEAVSKLRAIDPPSYLPGKLKGRFMSKAEAKLFGVIGTTVETAWKGCSAAFDEVAKTINAILEKALEKIRELISKTLEPLGNIVKEKFKALQEAVTITNDDLQAKDFDFIARFKPVGAALTAIKAKEGKLTEVVTALLASIDEMQNCHQFVGYLQYNLGDPDGLVQFVPFLADLQSNHYRLTIALTDCAYIIGRATVRAFLPIVAYLDSACDSFDAEKHKELLRAAVRESGRKLAIDYFSLPTTLRRSTWYCGRYTEQLILKLARNTIRGIADLIASFATTWDPIDAASANKTFVDSLRGPLNAFLNVSVAAWLNVVRRSMQDMISAKVYEGIGSVVDELCGKLDELCSALPEPFNKFLKPGALIKYMFNKLVMNAVVFGVKQMAKPTEALLYAEDADAAPKAMDEQLCRSLRWAPDIRKDDISFEPEKNDENEEEDLGDEEAPDSPGMSPQEAPDSPAPDSGDEKEVAASPEAEAEAEPEAEAEAAAEPEAKEEAKPEAEAAGDANVEAAADAEADAGGDE